MLVSARWQQWHVSATCPGEYEPFSLLLFSQCGMTLAPCLPGWLTGYQPVHLSVWPSVSLTTSQLVSQSPLSVSLSISPLVLPLATAR